MQRWGTLYLKGRHHWGRMTPESLTHAINCYEQAIRIDPNYTLAYAGLAHTYITGSFWAGWRSEDAYPKAREAAKKALTLNSSAAEAHCVLATISTFHDWDWAAAEHSFNRALELSPNSANIHMYHSFYLLITGKNADAVSAMQRARALDPLSTIINGHCGWALCIAGQYQDALDVLGEAVALDPSDHLSHFVLGVLYREDLLFEKSIAEFRRAVDLSGASAWMETSLAITCYRFGDREESERIFESLRVRSAEHHVAPVCFAFIHLIRAETDDAVRWLQEAHDGRDPFLAWFNVFRGVSRSLNLASDPRIEAILAEAGIP